MGGQEGEREEMAEAMLHDGSPLQGGESLMEARLKTQAFSCSDDDEGCSSFCHVLHSEQCVVLALGANRSGTLGRCSVV